MSHDCILSVGELSDVLLWYYAFILIANNKLSHTMNGLGQKFFHNTVEASHISSTTSTMKT